ncbi:hypothetical protein [Streptomyces sp. NPDC048242]|uniref:hypothetical protein n=1 Tax=Streptomyces sp. NPDC048242 TaxID=3155026 RepID=UPI00342EB5AA
MTVETTYFLLTYDRRHGKLLGNRRFKDEAQASAVYAATEAHFRGNEAVEVVLVGADSEQTLRHTHGHYFGRQQPRGSASAAHFLAALA